MDAPIRMAFLPQSASVGICRMRPKFHLAFATGALVLSLVYLAIHPGTDPGILDRPACVPFFVIGMTCGSLVHDGMVTPTSNPLASVIAGALIFVVFFSFHT